MIKFDKVTKRYDDAGPDGPLVLRNVSFEIADGECVSLVGPSGCGKTTILRIIAGLEQPTTGIVTKPDRVAMVFQSGALLPWLSVYDNIAFGLRAKAAREPAAKRPSESRIREIVGTYAEMTGISEFLDRYPRDLSGGQRQRIGIARALAVDPDVLLLDEPFSALDAKTAHDLSVDLVKIWQETRKTVVLVSHSIEQAVAITNRVFLIKDGTVAHEYPISIPRPRHEQGEAFMNEVMNIRRPFFSA
ncbi:MAG: ABC transporter ATP-binding protein [Patescibacteria group bacterium]|nr:ABC transporter ATP-binding protein [Patescibacteria group bacterium]MDE2116613.1 ABC transporter ATP-binding protein [Patescibacteria group bacterium]